MKKIFVIVSGGCAYAMTDTVPDGFQLEIIDFDNIAAGDAFPSTEANCSTRVLNASPRLNGRLFGTTSALSC